MSRELFIKPMREFHVRNLNEWESRIIRMFDGKVPTVCEWVEASNIVKVLNYIGGDLLVHVNFPQGGGIDFDHAEEVDGVVRICSKGDFVEVKAESLMFWSLGEDYSWDYFWLESYSESYLFVAKGCAYNRIPMTYHRLHDRMESSEFYKFMRMLKNKVEMEE
ncbi:hypothetical protein [Romboutsia sp.]|uniref:hypothetical protein n=1 Tax=Romboutsia sp. TaxID=1965302 RepID=UPI003F402CF3